MIRGQLVEGALGIANEIAAFSKPVVAIAKEVMIRWGRVDAPSPLGSVLAGRARAHALQLAASFWVVSRPLSTPDQLVPLQQIHQLSPLCTLSTLHPPPPPMSPSLRIW